MDHTPGATKCAAPETVDSVYQAIGGMEGCRQLAEAFYRRQLLLAAVTAGVVLASIVMVALVLAHGSRRWATWAVVAALVVVGGVLLVLLDHVIRIVRFALRKEIR